MFFCFCRTHVHSTRFLTTVSHFSEIALFGAIQAGAELFSSLRQYKWACCYYDFDDCGIDCGHNCCNNCGNNCGDDCSDDCDNDCDDYDNIIVIGPSVKAKDYSYKT